MTTKRGREGKYQISKSPLYTGGMTIKGKRKGKGNGEWGTGKVTETNMTTKRGREGKERRAASYQEIVQFYLYVVPSTL